jgi:UDP-GlcNAc:undecaprenyl-phosphate GlcNAc-1-phosphate transferase
MLSLILLGACSFALSLVLTPVIRNVFRSFGQVDRPDDARKRHAQAVPRVGGIPIVLSCFAAIAIVMLLPHHGGHALLESLPLLRSVVPALLTVFLTGILDDLIGLKPWQKLAGQIAAGGLAWGAGVHIGFRGTEPGGPWSAIVTIFWLVGCTNAFNLIDGVDGLAAGLGLFATLTTLVAALLQNSFPLALATVALAGSLVGFLLYNFNPASIFLGDCGSLSVGFLLGCYGVVWSQKSATMLGMTAPLMALAVPLLDTALAIARRILRRQPIFRADRRHIHHLLLDRGLTPRRVVLLLYAACGLAAILSLLQSVIHNQLSGLVIILFCLAAWVGVRYLGYVEFAVAGRLIIPGTFLRVLNARLRLLALERALDEAQTADDCWDALRSASREFGFTSLSMRLDHTLRQKNVPTFATRNCWILDVPLSDSAYVRLSHSFDSDLTPTDIGSLAGVLRRTLLPKLPTLRTHETISRAPGA